MGSAPSSAELSEESEAALLDLLVASPRDIHALLPVALASSAPKIPQQRRPNQRQHRNTNGLLDVWLVERARERKLAMKLHNNSGALDTARERWVAAHFARKLAKSLRQSLELRSCGGGAPSAGGEQHRGPLVSSGVPFEWDAVLASRVVVLRAARAALLRAEERAALSGAHLSKAEALRAIWRVSFADCDADAESGAAAAAATKIAPAVAPSAAAAPAAPATPSTAQTAEEDGGFGELDFSDFIAANAPSAAAPPPPPSAPSQRESSMEATTVAAPAETDARAVLAELIASFVDELPRASTLLPSARVETQPRRDPRRRVAAPMRRTDRTVGGSAPRRRPPRSQVSGDLPAQPPSEEVFRAAVSNIASRLEAEAQTDAVADAEVRC